MSVSVAYAIGVVMGGVFPFAFTLFVGVSLRRHVDLLEKRIECMANLMKFTIRDVGELKRAANPGKIYLKKEKDE